MGYIGKDNYYSDDYLYLLKSDVGYFSDFKEKIEFILENIEINQEDNREYAERRWKHEEILNKILLPEEKGKIRLIDCYKLENEVKKYDLCIAIDTKNETDIYMYSKEECKYLKISMEEFAKMVKEGLVPLKGVPRLRQFLKKKELDEETR